jgi:hypothetical protein
MLERLTWMAALATGLLAAAGALAQGAPAQGSSVKVSKAECRRIVAHAPAPDVAYKPGVDARGRKVAPADAYGANPIALPDEITIDIGFNLAEKYGLGTGGKYKGEGYVGKVTVRGDKVYWNNVPLDGADQSALVEACRKAYGK